TGKGADDLLDHHALRGRVGWRRAVVHGRERRAPREAAPKAAIEAGLGFGGVVKEVVLEVAPRVAVDALAPTVVANDLEGVAVAGQLVKEDAQRERHRIIVTHDPRSFTHSPRRALFAPRARGYRHPWRATRSRAGRACHRRAGGESASSSR